MQEKALIFVSLGTTQISSDCERRRAMMTTGNVGFFEIRVDDFQRAQKFYHDVFGWQFSESGGVPYEFYMIDTIKQGEPGNQEGGMRKREKPLTSEHEVSG